MEQKRVKVRLTENSPYSDYGYYEKGDIGYIDGYVNDNAVIILENGKFAKADLRWIEVVNEEDKNVNTELKESEDERIRKHIIEVLRDHFSGKDTDKCIAWLEKQQKSEVDPYSLPVSDDSSLPTFDESIYHPCTEKAYDQKPAWSEEDEYTLLDTIRLLCSCGKCSTDRKLWLLSLKDRVQPQPQWKPTDEQMNSLKQAISAFPYETDYLELLYDDLKKLKG